MSNRLKLEICRCGKNPGRVLVESEILNFGIVLPLFIFWIFGIKTNTLS